MLNFLQRAIKLDDGNVCIVPTANEMSAQTISALPKSWPELPLNVIVQKMDSESKKGLSFAIFSEVSFSKSTIDILTEQGYKVETFDLDNIPFINISW